MASLSDISAKCAPRKWDAEIDTARRQDQWLAFESDLHQSAWNVTPAASVSAAARFIFGLRNWPKPSNTIRGLTKSPRRSAPSVGQPSRHHPRPTPKGPGRKKFSRLTPLMVVSRAASFFWCYTHQTAPKIAISGLIFIPPGKLAHAPRPCLQVTFSPAGVF
jgi:hypothetical protein